MKSRLVRLEQARAGFRAGASKKQLLERMDRTMENSGTLSDEELEVASPFAVWTHAVSLGGHCTEKHRAKILELRDSSNGAPRAAFEYALGLFK